MTPSASSSSSAASHFWFPSNNFCRDASVSIKACRRANHYKIEVKFEFGDHPQNFVSYGPFLLSFRQNFGFGSIAFEGMHQFHSKFREG